MIKRIKFKITGLTPLIQHNPQAMLKKESGLKTKQIPSPEIEAESGAYRMDNGQLYISASAFRCSIINKGGGASGRRIGKYSAINRCSAALEIPLEYQKCPLFHPETGEQINTYKIDLRRVVIKNNAIIRARPIIEKWACELILDLDTDFITIEQAIELLNISGRIAGVGDNRPQCKGQYGKYKVDIIQKD